jgi:hypothetical protein
MTPAGASLGRADVPCRPGTDLQYIEVQLDLLHRRAVVHLLAAGLQRLAHRRDHALCGGAVPRHHAELHLEQAHNQLQEMARGGGL